MKCPLLIPDGESALLSHVARRERGAGTARLAEHIRECLACSAFTATQASVWQTLELWEAPPVSDEFNRKLYARIDQPEAWWNRTSQMFSNLVLRPTVPLALATMLLVTGIAVEMPRQTASPVPAPHTAPVVAPVDTEQLDKTFDDLQLLQQLDPKDEASGASDAI